MAAGRGFVRTAIDVVLTQLSWLPGFAKYRASYEAAASVTGEPLTDLLGPQADLHATPGTSCPRCQRVFGSADVVRVTGAGTVHDACPPAVR